jgi:ketosteroid isomerase-like protein
MIRAILPGAPETFTGSHGATSGQASHQARRWEEMGDELLYSDRECLFAELLAAFGRRDHDVIRASMRSDVVLMLPGSSPLAGMHKGIAEVGHFVVALRMVLQTGSNNGEISFLHEGDQMVVRHQVSVLGPQHTAEMVLRQRFTFDGESGKLASITVEPEDEGLFDYVVRSALGNAKAS